MLASSMTMMAFLPPISRDSFLLSFAADSAMARPVIVEPVNEITRTPGWLTSAFATSAPGASNKLNTPGGSPASSKAFTNAADMAGVSGDGFQMTVLPATRAGKIFQEGTAMGKFQGVIKPTTPEGSRTAIPNLFGISTGAV